MAAARPSPSAEYVATQTTASAVTSEAASVRTTF
jgi:hypothetical protein